MRKTRVDRGSEWTKAALIYTRLSRSITADMGVYRTSCKATWLVIYIREEIRMQITSQVALQLVRYTPMTAVILRLKRV